MPLSICKRINGQPIPSPSQIIQLDRTVVKVIGELKDVLIRLSSDPRVCQFIDIMVVDIPEAYGLILSRDWSAKLNGYFATNWSHLWLPHQNRQNQIKILREPHMKQNVTQLEGKNEDVAFSSSVLGNYFLEIEPGNYKSEEVSHISDKQPELLQFSWADDIDCNIVDLVTNLDSNETNLVKEENIFWTLYFDGSKT
jgi:hypothetical protein